LTSTATSRKRVVAGQKDLTSGGQPPARAYQASGFQVNIEPAQYLTHSGFVPDNYRGFWLNILGIFFGSLLPFPQQPGALPADYGQHAPGAKNATKYQIPHHPVGSIGQTVGWDSPLRCRTAKNPPSW
jgi:hypothetical protein